MRADVENQKKQLLLREKKKEVQTKELEKVLTEDDLGGLQNLLDREGRLAVLQPISDYPNDFDTAFHLSVEKKAEKCLTKLLEHPTAPKILDKPNYDGKTALLLAVTQPNPEMVQQLLAAGANANVRDDSGCTPLHKLVRLLNTRKKPDDIKKLLEMTDLLLKHEKIDLEAHANLTPLADAAYMLSQDNGAPHNKNLVTFCKKLVEQGASLQENTGDGRTVKEVLQNIPDLTSLPDRNDLTPPRPAPSCFLDLIVNNAPGEKLEEFLNKGSETEVNELVNSCIGKSSVLYIAVDRKNESQVKTLLEYGADPWMEELSKELPLHRAAAYGHQIIFDHLLIKMRGKDKKETLNLRDHTASLMEKLIENWKKNEQTSADISHSNCFDMLLEADVDLNLNQKTHKFGKTPVHFAASFNNQYAVMKLLPRGAFLEAPNVLPSVKATTLESAMDGCIKHLPHTTDENENEALTNETYTLLLDYRFLLPPKEQDQDVSEVGTLMDISRSKQHRHLIKHALVQTLLYAKWRKALPFYLLNLLLYLFFVIILSIFIYQLKDLLLLEAIAETSDQTKTANPKIEDKRSTVMWLKGVLVVLTFYMLVREIFQIRFSRKLYMKNIENYLEWILIVLVFVLCFRHSNADVTRHVAAWASIAAWYEFVLILGRAPPLALYITMLRQVSWNFLKFIVLFGALILAFTVSFNILLQNPLSDQAGNPEFQGFGSTLPKAIVMSTGEFEYSSLREQFSSNVFAFASTVLMFLIFLFLIFLVLMNVMNALAVTDTKEVVDDATLYSLMSRLELVYLIESLFLACPPKLKKMLPKLDSFLRKPLQLLSGPDQSGRLLTKINRIEKKKRLLTGNIDDKYLAQRQEANTKEDEDLSPSKLDGDTTECLRTHRRNHLERLEAEEQQYRSDSILRVEEQLKELKQTIAAMKQ